MVKKLFSRLFVLMFAGVLLVGCATDDKDSATEGTDPEEADVQTPIDENGAAADSDADAEAEAEENVITIDIVIEGETVADLSKEVVAPEGMFLLDIMEENYEIEATEEGFMTAIEGQAQDTDAGMYWLYYVNDEMPSVGAAEYVPELADHIEWRLGE